MQKNSNRSPYVLVCFQECERMNILLREIRSSLQQLDLGWKVSLKRDPRVRFTMLKDSHYVASLLHARGSWCYLLRWKPSSPSWVTTQSQTTGAKWLIHLLTAWPSGKLPPSCSHWPLSTWVLVQCYYYYVRTTMKIVFWKYTWPIIVQRVPPVSLDF